MTFFFGDYLNFGDGVKSKLLHHTSAIFFTPVQFFVALVQFFIALVQYTCVNMIQRCKLIFRQWLFCHQWHFILRDYFAVSYL